MALELLMSRLIAVAVVVTTLGAQVDQILKDDALDACSDVVNLLQSRSQGLYAAGTSSDQTRWDDPALTRMETLGDTYEAIGRALITQEALAASSSLKGATPSRFFASGSRKIGATQHRKAEFSRLADPDPMLQEEVELKNEVRQLRSRLLQYMADKPNSSDDSAVSIGASNASTAADASADQPAWMDQLMGKMDNMSSANSDLFDISDKVSNGTLKFVYYFCLALPFVLAAAVTIIGYLLKKMDADGDGHVPGMDAVADRLHALGDTMAHRTHRTCDLVCPKWCFDAFCGWCSYRIWLFVFFLVDITTGLAAWALYHDMLQPIAAQILSYLFIMILALSIISMALYEAKLRVFEPIFSVIEKLENANGRIQSRIETVVNQAETLTGLDLDGDGDKGEAGSQHQHRTAEELEEERKAKKEKRKKRVWCQ